jgi:hypothetical protein
VAVTAGSGARFALILPRSGRNSEGPPRLTAPRRSSRRPGPG